MRAEWETAAKSLGPDAPPTASPYAVSYYTLPKHWQFRAQLEQCSPGGNRLTDGDFEQADSIPTGWRIQQSTPEEVEGEADRVTADAKCPRPVQRQPARSTVRAKRHRPEPPANGNRPPPPQPHAEDHGPGADLPGRH